MCFKACIVCGEDVYFILNDENLFDFIFHECMKCVDAIEMLKWNEKKCSQLILVVYSLKNKSSSN